MKTLSTIILVTLFTYTSFAQQGEDTLQTPHPRVTAGAWGLVFGIRTSSSGVLPSLTDFGGYNFALRYQITDYSFLRGGIWYYGFSQGKSYHQPAEYEYTITLGVEYGYFLREKGPFHFYAASGPNISYSNEQHYYSYSKNRSFSIGVSGTIGIEWTITEYLTAAAEYSGSFSYRHNKEDRTYDPSSPTIYETWEVKGTGVRLLLSILL